MLVGTGKGQGLSSYTRMDLQRRFLGHNLELKVDKQPVARGNSSHLQDHTQGQVCKEASGLRALAWELRRGLHLVLQVWL